jgi:hypothetical protein
MKKTQKQLIADCYRMGGRPVVTASGGYISCELPSSNADGYRIDEYDAQLAMSPVKGNPFEAENFYPADGFFAEAAGCPPGTSMNYFGHCIKNKRTGSTSAILGDDLEEEISDIRGMFGRGRRRRSQRQQSREQRRSQRQERRDRAQRSRAAARELRGQSKLEQAMGQRAAGESLGRESQSDIELAKSLQAQVGPTQEKKGMSTTTKVLIGVGVLAVLGVGAYMLMKGKAGKGK